MLYMLKFRRPMGVGSGLIGPCPSHAAAETLGRHYCATQGGPGFRFISVEPAILTTMAALPAEQRARYEAAEATPTALPIATPPAPTSASTTQTELDTVAAAAAADRTPPSTPEPVASPLAGVTPKPRSSGRIGQ